MLPKVKIEVKIYMVINQKSAEVRYRNLPQLSWLPCYNPLGKNSKLGNLDGYFHCTLNSGATLPLPPISLHIGAK